MSDPVVTYHRSGSVGVITVDNPPVNALGYAVRTGLIAALDQAMADTEAKAIVIACAGRTFFAGADISEFGKPSKHPVLGEVIHRLENSAKPVVAALHGTALGGGFEIALGCHYRVAVESAQVGLPEVGLGIIPGAGGTQRLPRLIGAAAALDVIIGGKRLKAGLALEMGAVDAVVSEPLVDAAVAFAADLVRSGKGSRPTRAASVTGSTDDIAAARKKHARRYRGFNAPFRAIDAVEGALSLPFDDGLKHERALFEACNATVEARALQYAFFAQRQAAKVKDLPKETSARPIERAAVIGGGTMGRGIAMVFADAGIPVSLLEVSPDARDAALAAIAKTYDGMVARNRVARDVADARRAAIAGATDYADLANADLVVEAVFEEMAVKKKVIATLDSVVAADAIVATNTSYLDVNEIAAASKHPERVLGMHFFSPANVMKLLEVVRADRTSNSALATIMPLAKRLGKIPVVSGVCHGFIGNRMLQVYQREANRLLQEGATITQIDKAIYDFGLPMGPFAVRDLAGIDVGWRMRKAFGLGRNQDARYSRVADLLCEQGQFGQKTGIGFYVYEDGRTATGENPLVADLAAAEADELGIAPRDIADTEIVERCIYALINEGAALLDEGIAQRPSDIDIVWLNGYGFPAYRGGPMFFADTVGLTALLRAMESYRTAHGAVWTPAPLLVRLLQEEKTLAALNG
ncbi:MAG: enoyl-CoA hydratase/isomerase family protein [Alphaproteobacteria bacterium]|nr:enoyl-CoA hydratase/isomerase family protein [Alphaproteobacteria bacterium]